MDDSASFTISSGQIEADPEITFLVGVFVARWSLAEYSLMLALLVALGSRKQEIATTILASTPSAEAKIRIVLKSLAVAGLQPERHDAIGKAVKALGKLCEERNALMHHLWGRRSTGEIVTINYREPDPAKTQTIRTAASLKGLCNAVVEPAHGICVSAGSTWIDALAAEQLRV